MRIPSRSISLSDVRQYNAIGCKGRLSDMLGKVKSSIFRQMADYLMTNMELPLPMGLGKISVISKEFKVYRHNGSYTSNTAIDWKTTIETRKRLKRKDIIVRYNKNRCGQLRFQYKRNRALGWQMRMFRFRAVPQLRKRLHDAAISEEGIILYTK